MFCDSYKWQRSVVRFQLTGLFSGQLRGQMSGSWNLNVFIRWRMFVLEAWNQSVNFCFSEWNKEGTSVPSVRLASGSDMGFHLLVWRFWQLLSSTTFLSSSCWPGDSASCTPLTPMDLAEDGLQARQRASDVVSVQLPVFQVIQLAEQLAVKTWLPLIAEIPLAMLSNLASFGRRGSLAINSVMLVLSTVNLCLQFSVCSYVVSCFEPPSQKEILQSHPLAPSVIDLSRSRKVLVSAQEELKMHQDRLCMCHLPLGDMVCHFRGWESDIISAFFQIFG